MILLILMINKVILRENKREDIYKVCGTKNMIIFNLLYIKKDKRK